MGELLQRIQDEMKICLKSGNKDRLGVVRMLFNEVKSAQVNTPGGRERDWTDAEVLDIVIKYHKGLVKTIDEYPEDRRQPLRAEIAIVEEFLPRQMSESELIAVVRQELAANSERNFGALMKLLQCRYSGQINGKVLSVVLKSVLAEQE